MSAIQHCWKCGTPWSFNRAPGRSETCLQCGADLKVCLNCASYDKKVAYQCRDRRAEEVAQKDMANFCEWFEMARRPYVPVKEGLDREARARDNLKRLLGD
jgi:ribosome-binding protein aMBF1 (putative translation factor)